MLYVTVNTGEGQKKPVLLAHRWVVKWFIWVFDELPLPKPTNLTFCQNIRGRINPTTDKNMILIILKLKINLSLNLNLLI